jgi:hypothetical protein
MLEIAPSYHMQGDNRLQDSQLDTATFTIYPVGVTSIWGTVTPLLEFPRAWTVSLSETVSWGLLEGMYIFNKERLFERGLIL